MHKGIINNEVAVYVLGWAMDFPDPINNYQLFYGPNAAPGANYSQFRNASYDELFRRASGLAEGPERQHLFDAMFEIIETECVSVSGLARQSVYLFKKGVIAYPDSGPVNGRILGLIGQGAGGLAPDSHFIPRSWRFP